MSLIRTRYELPHPIPSDMQRMDLHIGCVVSRTDPDTRCVAVMHQPADTLLNEAKIGSTLDSWADVYEVVGGLLDQALVAWGPDRGSAKNGFRIAMAEPPTAAGQPPVELLMRMGELMVADSEQLKGLLTSGSLKPGYVQLLRDKLTQVLCDAGIETAPTSKEA